MNRLLNTKADEGFLALIICILANVTPEHAFKIIDNTENKGRYRKWTEYDFQQIELDRKERMSWAAIGEKYNTDGRSVSRIYNRRKKGLKIRK